MGLPRILSVARVPSQKTKFFKFFKVNFVRECPFWVEEYLCSLTEGGGCGVCACEDNEVGSPDALRLCRGSMQRLSVQRGRRVHTSVGVHLLTLAL
jgi:hypothetical protein